MRNKSKHIFPSYKFNSKLETKLKTILKEEKKEKTMEVGV
jgi:hypothetical protein